MQKGKFLTLTTLLHHTLSYPLFKTLIHSLSPPLWHTPCMYSPAPSIFLTQQKRKSYSCNVPRTITNQRTPPLQSAPPTITIQQSYWFPLQCWRYSLLLSSQRGYTLYSTPSFTFWGGQHPHKHHLHSSLISTSFTLASLYTHPHSHSM